MARFLVPQFYCIFICPVYTSDLKKCMILISWMLFKNFFQSLYDYDIYKLLESVFVQTMDREKNISFVLGTDLLCISPFNILIFSCYNLFGDLHDIRKNIIIYDKDRRLLTALQSTINHCILVNYLLITYFNRSNDLNQL